MAEFVTQCESLTGTGSTTRFTEIKHQGSPLQDGPTCMKCPLHCDNGSLVSCMDAQNHFIPTVTNSGSREEFAVSKHVSREWGKDDEEEESEEEKIRDINYSIIRSIEEDRQKSMIEKISKKVLEELKKEKISVSERYRMSTSRKVSYKDPEEIRTQSRHTHF